MSSATWPRECTTGAAARGMFESRRNFKLRCWEADGTIPRSSAHQQNAAPPDIFGG
jgi:hypothetical protein